MKARHEDGGEAGEAGQEWILPGHRPRLWSGVNRKDKLERIESACDQKGIGSIGDEGGSWRAVEENNNG